MNWGKCNSCGQYAWLPHKCQSFSVEQDWSHKNDGSGYEEAGTAHGMDAEDAAENWAEKDRRIEEQAETIARKTRLLDTAMSRLAELEAALAEDPQP